MNTTNLQDRCTVTLTEAPALMAAAYKNKFHLVGEPGVGKTSIVAELSRITGYPYAIIDVPNMGIGDAAIPIPDTETETLKY
jgi:midasin (ATPase involved in ribosome maturation)